MTKVTSVSVVLALGAAAAVPASARAGILTFNSDADFVSYESGGGFIKTFGGNVRWGNASGSGDWEYAIVNSGDFPIGAVGQTPWVPGSNAHDFTFTYDGAGSSTMTLGGIGSITRAVPLGPTSLFARVKDSTSPFSNLALIEIDLAYNGPGVDYSFNLLTGDANAEYWGVMDANLAFGFTVTAEAFLEGPGSAGSDPMYQLKIGIPAPGTGVVLIAGGLAMARRRR